LKIDFAAKRHLNFTKTQKKHCERSREMKKNVSILSIAYLATYLLLALFVLKLPPATLLKLVSTGPGHNTLILTLELICLNSSYIAKLCFKT
jgi:hypothetical protein